MPSEDQERMTLTGLGFILTALGTGAWVVCFWWMHRISSRQDGMLAELREQAVELAKLNRTESEVLQEVRPEVGEIYESLGEVSEKVEEAVESVEEVKKVTTSALG
jgi:signal transduction histidine kinase